MTKSSLKSWNLPKTLAFRPCRWPVDITSSRIDEDPHDFEWLIKTDNYDYQAFIYLSGRTINCTYLELKRMNSLALNCSNPAAVVFTVGLDDGSSFTFTADMTCLSGCPPPVACGSGTSGCPCIQTITCNGVTSTYLDIEP